MNLTEIIKILSAVIVFFTFICTTTISINENAINKELGINYNKTVDAIKKWIVGVMVIFIILGVVYLLWNIGYSFVNEISNQTNIEKYSNLISVQNIVATVNWIVVFWRNISIIICIYCLIASPFLLFGRCADYLRLEYIRKVRNEEVKLSNECKKNLEIGSVLSIIFSATSVFKLVLLIIDLSNNKEINIKSFIVTVVFALINLICFLMFKSLINIAKVINKKSYFIIESTYLGECYSCNVLIKDKECYIIFGEGYKHFIPIKDVSNIKEMNTELDKDIMGTFNIIKKDDTKFKKHKANLKEFLSKLRMSIIYKNVIF